MAKEKRDELVNRDRPMVPTKTWKVKHIMAEESSVTGDTIEDESSENSEEMLTVQGESRATDDTIDDESLENSEDIPTDMDVNIVFALSAEFHAPKA